MVAGDGLNPATESDVDVKSYVTSKYENVRNSYGVGEFEGAVENLRQ